MTDSIHYYGNRAALGRFLKRIADKSILLSVARYVKERSLVRGDNIQYVYADTHHKNPLCRVTPLNLISEEHDKEKYGELLLEAAETGRGYFGFILLE